MYPKDRQYSKEHEWILPDGEGGEDVTVGITQFAQDQLGDIVFVELPEVGKEIARGDVLGTIESVKAVSEIYAPISGTVTEVNGSLEEKPEVVNTDPHGEGWYCKMTVSVREELEDLMEADAYRALADEG